MPGHRDYATGVSWLTKIRIAKEGKGRSKYRTLKRRRSDEAAKETSASKRPRLRSARTKAAASESNNAAQDCLS